MPKIYVDVLIYKEGGLRVAHALQLDLVGTGGTEKEALAGLGAACEAQISHAVGTGNLPYIFKPAPLDVWRRFHKAQGKSRVKRWSAEKARGAGTRARKGKFFFTPEFLAVSA